MPPKGKHRGGKGRGTQQAQQGGAGEPSTARPGPPPQQQSVQAQAQQPSAVQAQAQQPSTVQAQQPESAQPPAGGRGRGQPSRRPPAQQLRSPQQPTPSAGVEQPPVTTAEKVTSPDIDVKGLQVALPSYFPRRPEPGTEGRKIQLYANYFQMEIPSGTLYHYDVEIHSERSGPKKQETVTEEKRFKCLSTRINRLVIEAMRKKYKSELNGCLPAFDGRKNMYTRRPLGFQEKTFKVPFEEEGSDRLQTFYVKVQFAAQVNLDSLHAVFERRSKYVPQEVIQALDIVLRNGPCLQLIPVGRSVFTPPDHAYALGGGREVWFGCYTSVRPAQWKPMLNIDSSATAFYESIPVIEFMCKILSHDPRRPMNVEMIRELRDNDIRMLSKELKDLRVEVTHLPYPRKYRVVKISREPAKNITFELEGQRSSVANYFAQKYHRLRYPHFPCIQSGTPAHPVYLPLEVCKIAPNQPCRKKLSDTQTSEMIRHVARPPAERFHSIKQSVKDVVDISKPYLQEFGIKISTEPTKLQGRILQPPSIVYGNEGILRPKDGSWNLTERKFFLASSLHSWVIVNLSPRCNRGLVEKFISFLQRIGSELGMEIAPPAQIVIPRRSMREELNFIKRNIEKCEMILVILTRQSDYNEIKQVAEVELSLQTQCIKDDNLANPKKLGAPLISNLLQKINTKLGGVNSSLLKAEKPAIFRRPIIIIGADVTHPAPGDKLRPSIAACVGSLDPHPSRYTTSIKVQMEDAVAKSRVEIIRDLKFMVKELLLAFYRSTRAKPEKIIFYRDGVSEGQFREVRDYEVRQIRECCTTMSQGETYQPALTFIVVQKRHHTRFMPLFEKEGVGRCRNIPPGTTVDTDVTQPIDFDFFLCSHFGIQGTSKPTHYYVVWDDSNFNSNDLQKLTYYLCHTYARCTRSVSIPAPVYYAHLAAYRARNHVIGKVGPIDSGSESSSGQGEGPATRVFVDAVNVQEGLRNSMYFV